MTANVAGTLVGVAILVALAGICASLVWGLCKASAVGDDQEIYDEWERNFESDPALAPAVRARTVGNGAVVERRQPGDDLVGVRFPGGLGEPPQGRAQSDYGALS